MNAKRESTLKIEENLEAALCYIFLWVTGIIFLLLEKKNKFVRFHAYQSTIVFLAICALRLITKSIPLLGPLFSLVIVLLWVFLTYKAFNGEEFALPIVGDLAKQLANKNSEPKEKEN